jgi:hypothetical protein
MGMLTVDAQTKLEKDIGQERGQGRSKSRGCTKEKDGFTGRSLAVYSRSVGVTLVAGNNQTD